MRKLLTFLIALAAIASISASSFGGSMMLMGVGKTGGGGSPFTFQGTQYIAGAGAGLSTTYAITTTSVSGGALVVVGFGVTGLAGSTITSVVYDPTGANVTMTQDAFHNVNHLAAVYSGVVSGTISAGSKNIVVTYSSTPQFQDTGLYLWTMTGLSSNLKQTSGSGTNNATLGVTAGHYMVGASVEGLSADYGLSTEVPTTVHTSADVFGPEWNTIISSNASFLVSPSHAGSTQGGDVAVATYH